MTWRNSKAGFWAIWALTVAGLCGVCHLRGFKLESSAAETSQVPGQGLKFETQDIKLKEIRAGEPLTCNFSFINTGPTAIEMTELRPGCGCLQPRLQQRHFVAGERGSLPLELKTLGQPAGPHTWHLTVVYREGDQVREQSLTVKCTVITEVSVQPAALTLLTKGTLSHEITLTDFRPQALRILRVESTSPYLTMGVSPFVKNALGHAAAKIMVHSSVDLPSGKHDEQIIIYTSDPLYRELKISVVIVKDVPRRVSAVPAAVTLESTALIRLRDSQEQQVLIDSVKSDDAALRFHWADGPGNQVTLRVTADDSAWKANSGGATINVQLAGPVREVLSIPVHWPPK